MLRATKRACGSIDNRIKLCSYNLSTCNFGINYFSLCNLLRQEKPIKIMIQHRIPYNGYSYQ